MKADQSKNRIPSKKITPGTPIILQKDSPDLIFLNPKNVIIKDGSGFVYDKFSGGINLGTLGDGDTGGEDEESVDSDNPLPFVDTVDMSDIESITFEEYVDPTTKITKYNAIIKIRNGSVNSSSVVGVDARIYDSASSSYTASDAISSNSNSPTFITPTPTVPSVIFDRTGSAIAWGWNDASGLGSFDTVTYQWIVTTLKTGGTTIASGTKSYPSSSTYAIGDSGKNRKYRVSSVQGDLPASSSARWLKVRTVVTGTNGKKYYSNYSTAI
jgi:hypothetical protein